MTDKDDAIDSMAQGAKAATGKATDAAREAAQSAIYQTKETAKQVFERIKAARRKAAMRIESEGGQ